MNDQLREEIDQKISDCYWLGYTGVVPYEKLRDLILSERREAVDQFTNRIIDTAYTAGKMHEDYHHVYVGDIKRIQKELTPEEEGK